MQLEDTAPRKRSALYIALWAILPAALIMFISVAIMGYGIYRFIEIMGDHDGRAIFPGKITTTLTPGEYNVWLYTYAIEDGNAYASSDTLPGSLTLTLADDSGEEVLLRKPGGSQTMSNFDEEAVVIKRFEITEAGDYTLYSEGAADPFVLSISEANFAQLMGWLFAAVMGFMGGIALATIWAIATIITLNNRNKKLTATGS